MDTNILRKDHPEGSAATDEACHFCYDSWVFLGYEGVDEDGEHVEVTERVPCRRCHPESF